MASKRAASSKKYLYTKDSYYFLKEGDSEAVLLKVKKNF